MTTIQFTPSATAPFQFQAIFDDETYNVAIVWNVYRQGWYINIAAENGVTVVLRALVASPPNYAISMTAGYFKSTLVYSDQTQTFTITP